ncbi:D-alanine--D-alanine ligase [Nocardioides sp. HM23]|uniref:D-alanine--D-alanine ligase family protein n=1 Tax=Nocardioides bizhenqiangii TaxID=3095076 RepID=UPI002AC9FB85|nr:D-alanine--D-alanine ligase [Nocardioides sp. HM23]MDZ5622590.1 D-alanine--D-alanine ligase [Nocardioides sp. HM23]
MNPLRVAVIGGGTSCEHDVSLASAAAAGNALTAAGHDVVQLTIDRDGMWRDGAALPIGLAGAIDVLRDCQVAVPMLHGPGGEDGTLAALCDLADVPYVGSSLGASAVAMDKWATKLVAEAIGVPTAPGRLVTRSTADTETFTHPVVVKPVAAGSSHGVSMVRAASDLAAALDAAFAVDDRVLVEDVVVGREIDLAVFGRADGTRTVPPALEIVVPASGIFDLDSKYDGSAQFRIPAPVSDADRAALESAAVAVYDALGCAGVARVDFFLTDRGPVLNEVNTIPGFTEHSQVPRMFAAVGTSYPELLDAMVREAVADRVTVP